MYVARNTTTTSSIRRMETLVSTSWLAEKLKGTGKDQLKVVHASWSQCSDYNEAHIPGAVCFDGESCRDQTSQYKNMLPKPEQFAEYVGKKLGIDNNSDIVIYDSNDATPLVMYSTRVWFMFRVFGHDRVRLLNGGFKRWVKENQPVTKEATKVTPKTFKPNFCRDLVLSYEDVVEKVVQRKDVQLIDARPEKSYKGLTDEPAGRPGHIRNALNVPVQLMIDPATGLMREGQELKKAFEKGGVDFSRPVATSCGTGMTATGVAFGAFLLGKETPVYDGSWYEWVRRAPDENIAKDN